MVSAEEALANVNERLLADEETKDVIIDMSDGVMGAHSIIMGAGSDAIRAMLRNGIAKDAETKTLCWKDHPCDVGRFFLRLLYTGAVNEDDWPGSTEREEPDGLKEIPITLQVTSPNGQQQYEGRYELVHEYRPNEKPMWKKEGSDRWIFGIDDKWCMCTNSTKVEGFTSAKGHIQSFEQQNHVAPIQVIGWRRHDGNRFVKDDDITVTEPQRPVPLRLLLGSMAIARRYLFADLLRVLVSALNNRLMPENFNAICAAAIKADSMSLRWHCVAYAQRAQSAIQKLYKLGRFSPEVQAELEGIWGDDEEPCKRRRYFR